MSSDWAIGQSSSLYRFGPYEVDTSSNELRKFGLRIRLERKPLQLLIVLLTHAGETVTRADLQHSLWGQEVFVDFDRGMTVAVTKLRAALSDSAEKPKYIETIAGEGYRFIGEVEHVTGMAVSQSLVADSRQTAEVLPIPGNDQIQVTAPAVKRLQVEAWRRKALSAVAVAACVALLIARVVALLRNKSAQPVPMNPHKIMLVVLPFENLSGDPSQEYLGDGMTEELSERLGNLNPERLAVIGRTSAMAYKHSTQTISQIGRDLGVEYVLEGSVRREGKQLRVTAQLVRVSDQAHVWAQDYDRDTRGLLKVEDEVASDVAQQVGASMALGLSVRRLQPHIPNPEAHEDYLVARYYWYKRTPEGWAKSQEYFRHAIEKDPQYAAAYAGLAESDPDSWEQALAAAKKAVELDPTSAENQTALAWVEYFREWDFIAAENAVKTAIQLDPNYAPAHHMYSFVLGLAGRSQASVDEEKEAVRLDPLALIFRVALAGRLSSTGQNDAGMEQINRLFAIDPHYPKAHQTLGYMYLRRGMYKEAIREFEITERQGGPKETADLGYAYARLGDKEAAMKELSELKRLDKASPSGEISIYLAIVEIGLGNRDAALAYLQKNYEQHDSEGIWDTVLDPMFAPLRSDPRFQALMGRVKFPT